MEGKTPTNRFPPVIPAYVHTSLVLIAYQSQDVQLCIFVQESVVREDTPSLSYDHRPPTTDHRRYYIYGKNAQRRTGYNNTTEALSEHHTQKRIYLAVLYSFYRWL